jgi:hypothetical protein
MSQLKFLKLYKLLRNTDDLLPNTTYKTLFITQNDIGLSDSYTLRFNKKPKPLLGLDPNAPRLVFDKIKIRNLEISDEMYVIL